MTVEVLCVPPIYRSSEDVSDLLDLSLSVDPNVVEEELSLLHSLELPGLLLDNHPDIRRENLGVPGEVDWQEYPVSRAAVPEHDLCVSLKAFFLPGGAEDVHYQVLVPDPPQVYASLLCFGTHLLKLLMKSLAILLLF